MKLTMSKPSIEDILAPKLVARPRIYAYTIADAAHKGLLKVGQTTRGVKQRVAEQLKTAAIQNFSIKLDEHAFDFKIALLLHNNFELELDSPVGKLQNIELVGHSEVSFEDVNACCAPPQRRQVPLEIDVHMSLLSGRTTLCTKKAAPVRSLLGVGYCNRRK